MKTKKSNLIVIEYCPGCQWLLRSAWMAQEILNTFENELDELSLRPARNEPGCFRITFKNTTIWCRKKERGFPQIKELKQRVRDALVPEKKLGHLDTKT